MSMPQIRRPAKAWVVVLVMALLGAAAMAAAGGLLPTGGTGPAPVAAAATPGPVASAGVALPASTDPAAPGTAVAAEPTIAQLVGQKLVVRMEGKRPSDALLGRIRRGEIGGVILFGFNIADRDQLDRLTARLQAAATDGGQPPLFVMVDQEGGAIRTVPWAPPTMSARQVGADGATATALDQGTRAGRALRNRGINVNLAPVADVPSTTSSFMYLAGRTYAFKPAKVSRLAGAFADGLRAEGVVPTMKHFPGIGRATRNTDRYAVTIRASRSTMADVDLVPYRAAIADGIPMIMLSNAVYPAWDDLNGAGWSPAIATGLLRTELGFAGVSITDSLSGTAAARGVRARDLAVKAARAGTDMVMLTGLEAATEKAFDLLVRKAEAGAIPLDVLRASYDRILALKSGL